MKLERRGDFLYVVSQYAEEKKFIEGFFQASLDGQPFFRLGRRYSSFPFREFVLDWESEKTQPTEDCFAARCALLVNKPKLKMLFLDDRTKRVESARSQFGGKFDLTIVSTVKECLRKLSGEEWDEVHLDHDLNGDDFQDPDSPTAGMEVVRYIVKCGWPPNKRKPIFRVHSSNIFASWLMVRTLHEVGLIAFWERFEYKDGDQCAS